jgi:hypothetical protein
MREGWWWRRASSTSIRTPRRAKTGRTSSATPRPRTTFNQGVTSVAIETGATFEADTPTSLFKLSLTESPSFAVRNDYAVSPDGQRFLVVSVDPSDGAKLNVLVNWEAMLEPR